MITLKGVNKQYQHAKRSTIALDNVDLHVKEGHIFGIIGQSGAGKSTLIRTINLLERPDSGAIFIDSENATHLNKQGLRRLRHKIGMIFQHFNLLSSKTIFENVALPLKLAKLPKSEISKKVYELLELTALLDLKDRLPSQLSGGQKQRVAIARALVHSPKILLSDEATSALDPQSTQSILSLLKRINKNLGITILLITHEMEVIKTICDDVAVIHQGKIIEQNAVFNIFSNPQTPIASNWVNSASRNTVPLEYQTRIAAQPKPNCVHFIKIIYQGEVTSKPFISSLIKKYNLTINIIQANMEVIQGKMLGIMMVEIDGELSSVNLGLSYLEKNGMHVVRLGYV